MDTYGSSNSCSFRTTERERERHRETGREGKIAGEGGRVSHGDREREENRQTETEETGRQTL